MILGDCQTYYFNIIDYHFDNQYRPNCFYVINYYKEEISIFKTYKEKIKEFKNKQYYYIGWMKIIYKNIRRNIKLNNKKIIGSQRFYILTLNVDRYAYSNEYDDLEVNNDIDDVFIIDIFNEKLDDIRDYLYNFLKLSYYGYSTFNLYTEYDQYSDFLHLEMSIY